MLTFSRKKLPNGLYVFDHWFCLFIKFPISASYAVFCCCCCIAFNKSCICCWDCICCCNSTFLTSSSFSLMFLSSSAFSRRYSIISFPLFLLRFTSSSSPSSFYLFFVSAISSISFIRTSSALNLSVSILLLSLHLIFSICYPFFLPNFL